MYWKRKASIHWQGQYWNMRKKREWKVKKRQKIFRRLQETDFREGWEKPGFMVET